MSEPGGIHSVRLCIDANDVDRVTEFWASVFGYEVRATDPPDDWYQVMADPEGNEFCICRENQPVSVTPHP